MATLRGAIATALACGLLVSAVCPVARASEGELVFGEQWWRQSAPDAKFQEFSQVPRGAFLESYLLREWAGRNSVALWGANAIRADQATKLTWANGVRWRVDLSYARIPHTFSQISRWGWTETGPGAFTLPDTLQARNQQIPGSYTQRMLDFARNAAPIDLGFDSRNANLRLRARPVRGWQFEFRGSQRKRFGFKPYGLDFGFNTALENPEPIDQRMLDGDFIASYQHDRLSAQASAGLSKFDNYISTLRVDNPKRITDVNGGDGPKVGALDLYPNNRVIRGSVALACLMPKRTAVAATLSVAAGKQDDAFLPFTSNSALPQSNPDSLPARSLDGKTRQINGDVRLTTTPVPKLDGALRFHYTDYDNRTKELTFIGQSPYDVSWQNFLNGQTGHINSNKQWQTGIDLDYQLVPQAKVGGIAEYRLRERTEREVDKDHETVLGGRIKLRTTQGFAVDARYTRGDRKIDKFLLDEYDGLKQRLATGSTPGLFDSLGAIEQPGLRRFDVANRVQDNATAGVSYMLGERLELSGNYAWVRNDFKGDTLLGLKQEKTQTAAGSATFHVSDQLDVNGGYSYGITRSDQVSRASAAVLTFNPDSNWSANLKDTEHFVFAGFDWDPTARVNLSASYQLSRNRSKFDLTNHSNAGQNNAADLPDTKYSRHELVLTASWRWLEKTTLMGRWGWEEYDVDDWATNDVPLVFPVTGTANAIYLGDSSQGYRANRFAALVRHSF